jgi:uncharacterized protein YukJ
MPIENYGVLKGRILDGRQERYEESPHYQILVEGEKNLKYRVAVNVMSRYSESEILYYASEKYHNKNISLLKDLPYGFTSMKDENKNMGLDYIRGKIMSGRKQMVLTPHNKPGPSNDLNDFFHSYIKNSKQYRDDIYVFGSKYGPEDRVDPIFGFEPMQGMHNVHMNQGNADRWKRDNGIWQDGGILIRKKDRWIAIFLAFVTQSWKTNNEGDPVR